MTLLLIANLGYAWGSVAVVPSTNDKGMSSSKLTRRKRTRKRGKGAR